MLMTMEIPLDSKFTVRSKSKSSALEVQENWTLDINIPSINAPISTNQVCIFKLTIEDYFKHYFGFIRSKFFSLSLIKSVAFFLGHPVVTIANYQRKAKRYLFVI